ncbi:hypothetical protein KR044_001669 [Drosophila immigrans]|nr:hypothetical protein KR044_001669 [Drosophila immigrans]
MSHHLPQESQQQPERGRQQQRGGGGIMDLRNFCQRLDVDGLKAKLPAMPQLKLPKSLPKLRGARRIFRGESGIGSGNKAVPQRGAVAGAAVAAAAVAGATSGHQAAQFINRTPQRISTISSLMHEQTDGQQQQVSSHHLQPSGATYCSAGSLDDDYYAPYGSSNAARASRPISPIKMPAESQEQQQQQGGTLTQRLQRGYKSLSELRLKHLFAKQTVVRRDGIEVQRYVEQYEAERRVEQMTQARRDRQIADNYDIHISTLPITRQNTLRQSEEKEVEQEDDESGLETPPAVARKRKPVAGSGGIAATRFAKVRQPPLQMPVAEESQDEQQPAKQQMRQAVKQQLKRLRKSIKRRQQQQQQSDEGQPEQRASAASTLRARMRRFASSEQLPQRWRQSFTAGGQATAGAGAGVADAATAAAGGGGGVAAQLERGLGKLNEKLQQLKFFQRKSQQQQQQQNKPNTVGREPVEIDDEELAATYHHSDSDSDDGSDDSGQDVCAEEAFGQLEQQQSSRHQTLATLAQFQAHASTAWSSDSLEEIDPLAEQQQQRRQQQQLATTACDYPRVLIHQQHNTDGNESTLIIAVTTTPPTPTPPHSQQHQWVPNEQIIAGFNEQPAPVWPAPQLYKPKSIDIFESGDAFADFDEALRNAPVLRISAGSSDSNGDGDNDGDGDEDADDSSSRVTRIRVQTPQIGNSCESLMEQQTLDQEEQQEEEHEELERPPSVSPPPPPLPQRRAPPPSTVAPIYDAVPPPLPISKPPATTATAALAPAATATTIADVSIAATSPVIAAPPACRQPLRSASMTRPAKPLVKTSSLRLTYREQMHPNDVGKVNKLISRFGGRPRRLHSEELTICSDDDDDDDDDDVEEPTTPTPSNHNNNIIPDIVTTAASSNNNNNNDYETMQLDRQNSNCSRSEYGSPLAYPQQQQQLNATATTATTTTTATTIIAGRAGRTRAPQPQLQLQAQSLQLQRRSRRSMTRDDDNFYSFDSDEENSYYSISPSSSSRYVVEI